MKSVRHTSILIPAIVLVTGFIYYFSNPMPQHYYDYTYRVADNILSGHIGFAEQPPSWLNEFVPLEGHYYSVFPLGSVVTMIPFVTLKAIRTMSDMPGSFIAALSASVICLLLFLISLHYDHTMTRRALLVLAIPFGTWMWVNVTFAGAWQLALGFAMIGEIGTIYFSAFNRKPILAGLFFAIAFGNRTEILLVAPVLMYLMIRQDKAPSSRWKNLALFCVVPFLLGIATLAYNDIRFHSFLDFGYARIPGVLQEPWYNHGIFSIRYIPGQAWEMLMRPWERKPAFPYLLPNGFSSSILLSSPFLLLAFRRRSRDRMLKYASWLAVVILTTVLWMHGNSGGWQFGYRYFMICLPWLFVILLENSPKKINALEWSLYGFSFVANAYAVYLFHWSPYMKV